MFKALNDSDNIKKLLKNIKEQSMGNLPNLNNPDLINNHLKDKIKNVEDEC